MAVSERGMPAMCAWFLADALTRRFDAASGGRILRITEVEFGGLRLNGAACGGSDAAGLYGPTRA